MSSKENKNEARAVASGSQRSSLEQAFPKNSTNLAVGSCQNGMKLLHISDTHGAANQLVLPDDVDILIFSGDSTNYRDLELNRQEFESFLYWVERNTFHIPIKLFVPGNHDLFCFKRTNLARGMLKEVGMDYVEDDYVTVGGVKIWGSPWSPTFGSGWGYMADRSKLNKRWQHIPDDTEILITHGPPKGILDLTEGTDRSILQVGDSALMKRIQSLKNLKLHCFGHIHSTRNINNNGILFKDGVYYSNAAAVKDGSINKVHFHGNLFEI